VAREDNLTGVQGAGWVAIESSLRVHNLVVCALCSCYPWSLLGLPQWADQLGLVFKEVETNGEYDTGHRYYDHWLIALEHIVVEKKLIGWEDLKKEGDVIVKTIIIAEIINWTAGTKPLKYSLSEQNI
jgi:hypothetical protein